MPNSNSLLMTKVDFLNCIENVLELNSNFPISRTYMRVQFLCRTFSRLRVGTKQAL